MEVGKDKIALVRLQPTHMTYVRVCGAVRPGCPLGAESVYVCPVEESSVPACTELL